LVRIARLIAGWTVGVGLGFIVMRVLDMSVLFSLLLSLVIATVVVLMTAYMSRPPNEAANEHVSTDDRHPQT